MHASRWQPLLAFVGLAVQYSGILVLAAPYEEQDSRRSRLETRCSRTWLASLGSAEPCYRMHPATGYLLTDSWAAWVCSWVQEQLREHGGDLWISGAEDYAKHARDLLSDFADVISRRGAAGNAGAAAETSVPTSGAVPNADLCTMRSAATDAVWHDALLCENAAHRTVKNRSSKIVNMCSAECNKGCRPHCRVCWPMRTLCSSEAGVVASRTRFDVAQSLRLPG